jgi:hypothetical protein
MATSTLRNLQRALAIAEQIDRLENELRSLVGTDGKTPPTAPQLAEAVTRTAGKRGGRRSFSAETRAKMAEAQRARWAQRKEGKASPAKPAKGGRKKRVLTPEGRARIAAAIKARWERARKAGAPAPNARKKK